VNAMADADEHTLRISIDTKSLFTISAITPMIGQ
jgi:hypothetical protein